MTIQSAMFRPDDGEAPAVGVTVTPTPVEPSWLDKATGWIDAVPAWGWATALGGLFVVTLLTLPIASRLAFRAGRRVAGHTSDSDGRDRIFLIAAIAPAVLLWIAVLIGSARGLIGFGRDTLRWQDGWETLVPLTLDGVGISFGLLAFLAIRNNRNPDRSARLAAVAMLAGAGINFGHEAGLPAGSWLGGAYLALMSSFGLMIFHELLAQFEDGAGTIRRTNPKFGLRWITWPSNTACAWVAWRNYPPTPLPKDATEQQKAWWGSINHAVAHLGTVRRAKRIARFAADVETGRLVAPWWMSLAPWARVRQLNTVLSARDTEMAEMSTRLAQVVADVAAERRRGADVAERLRVSVAEKVRAENDAAAALRQAEDTRADLEQQIARLREQSTATVHRTESLADRRITVAQTELQQATARLDQLEQQWIDANRKAAVLGQQLSAAQAETVSVRLSGERSEKDAAALRTALTEATEKHRTELAETVVRLQAESAETIARIRAENVTDIHSGERSRPRSGQRSKAAEKRSGASNGARMTDEEAVQALLRKHPEPEYPWKQLEVRDVTGAGFGRIPNLLSALAEYHRSGPSENGRSAVTGEAEGRTGEMAVNGSHRRPESPNGARGDLSDDDKEDSPDRPRQLTSATA